MRLSAVFNFFDGGELLVPALCNIRPHVDHISLITQDISNYGNAMSVRSKAALDAAVALGLIDTLSNYTPDLTLPGGINEFRKRAMGIRCARNAGADHLMFCDVDEFYRGDQLEAAKSYMVEHRVDFSTVGYQNYYRRPTWRLVPGEDFSGPRFNVSFLCRMTDQTVHEHGSWYPVIDVDPTRRIHVRGGRHHFFAASAIAMHHMTGVRLDMEEKLSNSSCNDNPRLIGEIRKNFALLPELEPGENILPDGQVVRIEEVADFFDLARLFPARMMPAERNQP